MIASRYTEKRTMNVPALRSLCSEKNWYTRGSLDDFDHLLWDLAGGKPHLEGDDLIGIAKDIADHSDPACLFGQETISTIAEMVSRLTKSTFVREIIVC